MSLIASLLGENIESCVQKKLEQGYTQSAALSICEEKALKEKNHSFGYYMIKYGLPAASILAILIVGGITVKMLKSERIVP